MSTGETTLNNSNEMNSLQGTAGGEVLRPIRDELGKFLPGNIANPDGRPKSRLFSEELREILSEVSDADETGARKLAKKTFKMANQDKDDWLSLAAIKEIRDTTEGKPTQNMAIRGTLIMMPADQVIAETFTGDEPE